MSPVKDRQCKAAKGRCRAAKGHWHCHGCNATKLHEHFTKWIIRFGLSRETRTRCDLCTTAREEARQSAKGHWHCRGCDTIKLHEDFAMWIIRFGLCRRGAKTKCDSCTTAVWREFRPRLSKTSQLHVAHDQPQISRDHCKRAKGTLNPPPFWLEELDAKLWWWPWTSKADIAHRGMREELKGGSWQNKIHWCSL